MTRYIALALLLHVSSVHGQGYSPAEAVKRMKLPDGFSARCVASEPMIRQPLSISFDERGRMWVLQYIQYPTPAGLKAVKQDQYLRTIWDRVPESPPKGPKGADKLTICYDPDEHGVFRKSKDFLTGLNLASGFCLGNGGVYVLQSPYLLFYPDKNGDDIPDGDPEVLLTGFGFNDTHSVANSLQFGPDGWLYGAAGSTSTSKIQSPSPPVGEGLRVRGKEIEFQQGVWRYHPKSKRFELFSEGGGNTFGLDFDKNGQCITGTNWGGFAMLHQMQGAYYVKGFSKHGPLHNPHAYGYFDHVPYKNFQGGHVTCGGVLYEADAYPKEYRGQYIAGNLLSNCVNWHIMTPKGASFTAEHGGTLLAANDSWFRPVDLQLGPDGCIYVADWYDKRAAHLDPIDDWDKTNGRVYRIEYKGGPKYQEFDLRKKTSKELVELLKHDNMWWRKEAKRLIAERDDKTIVAQLRKLSQTAEPQLALESLWTIHALGTFYLGDLDNSDTPLLNHKSEHIRAWVARLQGDAEVTGQLNVSDLITLAKTETSLVVLAQLACTAKRLDGSSCRLAMKVANRPGVENDPYIPLLCWWAIEHEAIYWPLGTIKDFGRPSEWGPVVKNVIAEKLARRYMAEKSDLGYKLAGELLQKSWYDADRATVLRGIESGITTALTARELKAFNEGLIRDGRREELDKLPEPDRTRILAKFGDDASLSKYLAQVNDAKLPEPARIAAIRLLSDLAYAQLEATLVNTLKNSESMGLRTATIAGLARTSNDNTAAIFLDQYAHAAAPTRKQLRDVLLTRPAWARALFQAFDTGKFPKADLTLDHARIAVALQDKALTALVEKHFGKIAAATPGEKQARIAALNSMLNREKPGDPALGKVLFTKTCAACHQLHGEGIKVGPDLTTADRKNRVSMLTNIVDPSGYIRPEFVSYTFNTHDGRILTGMVAQPAVVDSVILMSYANSKVEQVVIAKKDIDTMLPTPVSMMPEKLLDTMSNDEVRHLFAYLISERPLTPHPYPTRGEGDKNKKLRIALVSGALEYKSDEALTKLQKLLEEKYSVECVRLFRKTDTDIPGIEKIADCDLAIFFTRRLKLEGEQLDAVKKYSESGKPILGIRTASHGFQTWLEMDKLVYGGNYQNHYGAGPKTEAIATAAGKDHAILNGVKPFSSPGSLYKNSGLAKDVIVLQTGKMGENTEPLTWIRERKLGDKTQRIFYTSLGHQDDFDEANFNRLIVNAIGWCVKDEKTFAK